MHIQGTLFVIYGPTGGGKTTICHEVAKQLAPKGRVQRVVTYTTRQPRLGEQQGIDYYFVDAPTFEAMYQEGQFFEINQYDGNWYGTPISLRKPLAAGISLMVVTDRNGAARFKQEISGTVLLWIGLFDVSELGRRICQRAQHDPTINQAALQKRLSMAAYEVELEEEDPLYDLYVLNQDRDKTVAIVASFIEFHLSRVAGEAV